MKKITAFILAFAIMSIGLSIPASAYSLELDRYESSFPEVYTGQYRAALFQIRVDCAAIGSYDAEPEISNGKCEFLYSKPILGISPQLQLVDERTMMPLRYASELLGFKVSWNDYTNTATVKAKGRTVSVTIGSKVMTVIDEQGEISTVEIEVPAQLIGPSTYLPLRAVGEALHCTVKWYETLLNRYNGFVAISEHYNAPVEEMDYICSAFFPCL